MVILQDWLSALKQDEAAAACTTQQLAHQTAPNAAQTAADNAAVAEVTAEVFTPEVALASPDAVTAGGEQAQVGSGESCEADLAGGVGTKSRRLKRVSIVLDPNTSTAHKAEAISAGESSRMILVSLRCGKMRLQRFWHVVRGVSCV